MHLIILFSGFLIMALSYLDKLADVLIHYSNEIQPGQIVSIHGDPVSMPLVEILYQKLLEAKAHPFFLSDPQSLKEIFYETASAEQLKFPSPFALFETQTIDATFRLWGTTNTKAFSQTDPKRQAMASLANAPTKDLFLKRAAEDKLAWVGTQYPTAASAQDAHMSLQQYQNFVFSAGHLNHHDPISIWRQIETKQQKVVDYMKGKKTLHFKTDEGTDLHVNVEDMTWLNSCGKRNFPDGEVFTGPNLKAKDGGVNGKVKVSFPACHMGREVNNIEIHFENGQVKHASASSNEAFLHAMIGQDKGSSYVGEIALGTNYQITNFSKNTLFDEKIGGTFHFALGSGYPQTGNTNASGLHWDMICDLRNGGEVYCDGELISKNGVFVNPEWPRA